MLLKVTGQNQSVKTRNVHYAKIKSTTYKHSTKIAINHFCLNCSLCKQILTTFAKRRGAQRNLIWDQLQIKIRNCTFLHGPFQHNTCYIKITQQARSRTMKMILSMEESHTKLKHCCITDQPWMNWGYGFCQRKVKSIKHLLVLTKGD